MRGPPEAKLVGGVWLPVSERHFEEWMTSSKRAREVDGKLTYQYHKLEAAMAHQGRDRRRVCLDIGAHVGLWSMWLVREFAYVHAFEPVAAFAELFPFNVAMERVSLHRVALGAEAKTVAITVPLAQTGAAHVAGRDPVNVKYNPGGEMETHDGIEMRTLDSFAFKRVDFVKIDVEGYEVEVLRGAEQTIRRWRPNIVVEQKGNEQAFGHERDAALALLKSWGMRPLEVISGDWIMGWP